MRDEQGAGIPGATITLISETRGTTFEGQSAGTGDYVLTNLPGDTYTVSVTMDGFKTSERKGVVSDSWRPRRRSPDHHRASARSAETVLVTGDAPMIQAQTGERSFTVAKEAVENLPVTLRYFGQFAALAPGVITTGTNRFARIDGARTNYMLDGISSVNTGGNQPGLELNADAIAEVKVVASAYQAEYGRSTGIQISGITKSGTNQFRGSIYDIERQGKWNSNSWQNVRNGNLKPVLKEKDWGYTIGGPVGKPGGQNRLFFFYSEQFSPRTSGGAINRFRVPTLLERQGDFSQTTDNNGARFNLIRDASTGLPCIATDTRGCFQAGGVLGRIPQDRLYRLGLNILKTYPEPNTQGLNYNLETVAPTVDRNTFQHVVRVDYQASSKLRLSAKYAGQNATVQTNPGIDSGLQRHRLPVPGDPRALGDGRLHAELEHGARRHVWPDAGQPARQRADEPGHQSQQRRASAISRCCIRITAPSLRARIRRRSCRQWRRRITSTAAWRWRRAISGAAASAAEPQPDAAEQRLSAVSLHAEHPRRGDRPDEAVGIAHLQGRVPVAGQHEAAEPRHRHLRGAPVRGQSQLRQRQQQPAGFRFRVRQCRARRVLADSSSRTLCSKATTSITTRISIFRTTGR